MGTFTLTRWWIPVVLAAAIGAAWYGMTGHDRQASNSTPDESTQTSSNRDRDNSADDGNTADLNTTPATSELQLRALFPANEEHEALAIIQLGNIEADLFATGSDVYGIARLVTIMPDHVILMTDAGYLNLQLLPDDLADGIAIRDDAYRDREEIRQKLQSGELSVLSLTQDAAAMSRYTGKDKSVRTAKLYTKRAPPGSRDYLGIYEQARQSSLESQDGASWAFLSYEPEIRQDAVTGLRLTGHEEMALLNQHGLEFGDVITRVNGKDIDSRAAAVQAMSVIGEQNNLELTIERGSQTQTVSINKSQNNIQNDEN